ncbi:MAG: large conductance mechanosensitive channel protein MscL [Clostridia bacterium]|nr:large conductance mechanosensitive channel protein MscL [Clostridia bacterium]
MKKIIGEFKKFITRGNIVDMAVGVIVGSSFTAIVNALSNNILKPIINYLLTLIFGANSLSEVYTFLTLVTNPETGEVDLTQSIYIDWGTFINAIINFLLVAIVLFTIVKLVNTLRDGHKKLVSDIMQDVPTKADLKEMKKQGIKLTDENIEKFLADKKAALEEAAAKEKAEAEEKARLERLANPTTEDLLKDILAEIRKS